jgi:hypothetical protein
MKSMREHIARDDLALQFETVLSSTDEECIDISNATSSTITELLHKYAYRGFSESATQVSHTRARYSDGSLGELFSLRALWQRHTTYAPTLKKVTPLRVAMISMRHYDMDSFVDMAWLLNTEVPSSNQPLALAEQFCYDKTRQQLQEGLRSGPLKLHFYQTGYQPVTIGFFRAVIDELLERESQLPMLEVVPYYYSVFKGYYWHGHPWN